MMVRLKGLLGALAAVGCLAGPVAAQDQTLADIRQQLSMLYVEIQGLRTELSTTGLSTGGVVGNTPLDRLNAIEAELQRLTSKTEELEFRVNRITVDGTNRIGDLEFRLCEVEPGCDIGLLGETPSLGGVDNVAEVPTADPAPQTGGPALAVNEEADFQRAQEALASSDFRGAADQFTTFITAYPAGPLTSEAYYLRGQALEELGEMSAAARSYLDGFSGDPEGPIAADALFKLGTSLAALGQVPDACVTLAEVLLRFPSSDVVLEVNSAMRNLGCS